MENKHMKTKENSLCMKALWNKACEFDNVPANSMFVVFSPKNPWMVEYNARMSEIFNRMVR
jgi:hypothetical protein